MSTEAQIAANCRNAQAATGPRTESGKSRSAGNAITLGLFTMNDFVLPGESAEHQIFCGEFWDELHPVGPVEETWTTEMIRAAWRLRRCGILEADLAEAPAETPEQNEANLRTQTAIDRARAQANNIFHRAHNDLRRLQAERHAQSLAPIPAPQPPAAPRDGFEFSNPPTPQASPQTEFTNRTQSIPRSAPCPCGSREKYKRCCGRNAPALLNLAA